MRAALTLVVLLAAAFPAAALDLPRYDPNTDYCEYVGTLGGGHPEYRHVWIEGEQRAYEGLKTEWPQATEEEQAHAIRAEAAANRHGGSYKELEAFLDAFHQQHVNQRRLQELQRRNTFTPD